jgi:hypothetical protein
MLREIFYRDWLLNRRMLLISYAMFLAFQIATVRMIPSARMWMIFACIYSTFIAVTVFLREDRFQSLAWTCSLPIERRELVRARFLEAWVLVLATMAAAILCAALLPFSQIDPLAVLQPTNLLLGLLAVTIIVAIMLPFTIRFGFMGMFIFLIGTQVLGVVAFVGAKMFRGVFRTAVSPIALVVGALRDFVIAARFHLGEAAFFVVALAVLALVNYLGYLASCWLFARREL